MADTDTPVLNLPAFDADYRLDTGGRLLIFDSLRRKYVVVTPEETVRQHFVHFLTDYLGYPVALMANEVGIRQNGCLRRCDTVVYDRSAHPLAIIEYKSPQVPLTAAVFDQIVRYNMVLGVRTLMVSNGLRHFCCRIDDQGGYTFLREIPGYDCLLQETGNRK